VESQSSLPWGDRAGAVRSRAGVRWQLLQPGNTQCFTISDTGTVWVLVNPYQKDLPYVRVGDTVSIQTDAYPDSCACVPL